MLTQLLYRHRLLYALWLLLFVFGLVWTIAMPPETALIFLNQFDHPWVVELFSAATKLGEWIGFLLALFIILIRFNYRRAIGLVLATLLVVLLAWFLKHVVYSDVPRPVVYLERMGIVLPNHSDYTLNRKFSFPSGHTAAGFTYFMFAGLCFSSKKSSVLFVFLAFMVALSRVYLTQHFVADTMAGSLLGTFVATVIFYFWVYRKPWEGSFLDKKIIGTNG